jgi:hypothetical protein
VSSRGPDSIETLLSQDSVRILGILKLTYSLWLAADVTLRIIVCSRGFRDGTCAGGLGAVQPHPDCRTDLLKLDEAFAGGL